MPPDGAVPAISSLTLRLFRRIATRYFRRHFRSVMLRGAEHLAQASGPLIVFANHSSWWDPMLSILLAYRFLPHRRHYAPIDAVALRRYPILARIGLFPVDLGSPRGAVEFLRRSEAILRDGGVLWVTPQGRFADPREQPLHFKPGLAALALRVPEARLLPLAIEYTFWDERLPEALAECAPPEALTEAGRANTAAASAELVNRLTSTVTALQHASIRRDAAAFQPLLTGARGTGGVYGWMQRLRLALHRDGRNSLDHTERPENSA